MKILDAQLRAVIGSQTANRSQSRWLVAQFCAMHGYDLPELTNLKELLLMQETAIITSTLMHVNWNAAQAARDLGMRRTQFVRRMAILNIHSRKDARRDRKAMAAHA